MRSSYVRNDAELIAAYNAGRDSVLEKNAWIFSLPLATSGVASSVGMMPRRAKQIVTGEDIVGEKKSRLLSALQLALLLGGGLWSLGWGGSGLQHLGAKLALTAKRGPKLRTGKFLSQAEKDVLREMSIPAWTRHSEGLGRLWGPLKGLGYVSGGIAHPFNKLENLTTSGIAKVLGKKRALQLGKKLQAASQSRLFTKGPVAMMERPLMLSAMMGAPFIIPETDPVEETLEQDMREV